MKLPTNNEKSKSMELQGTLTLSLMGMLLTLKAPVRLDFSSSKTAPYGTMTDLTIYPSWLPIIKLSKKKLWAVGSSVSIRCRDSYVSVYFQKKNCYRLTLAVTSVDKRTSNPIPYESRLGVLRQFLKGSLETWDFPGGVLTVHLNTTAGETLMTELASELSSTLTGLNTSQK